MLLKLHDLRRTHFAPVREVGVLARRQNPYLSSLCHAHRINFSSAAVKGESAVEASVQDAVSQDGRLEEITHNGIEGRAQSMSGYEAIIRGYLDKAWARSETVLQKAAPGVFDAAGALAFPAFGLRCVVHRDRVLFDGNLDHGPRAVLAAIYLAMVPERTTPLHPLKAFKEIPNSGPYQAAFAVHAEQALVPYVGQIRKHMESILSTFSGHRNTDAPSGDFSFTLYPLPRVPLYYIIHEADDEFPAAVTCLFGADCTSFMPLDALADVAEYTAQSLIHFCCTRQGP